MDTTIEVVLPIFALVLCGYLARHWRIMTAEGTKGLSTFVFNLAIPALVFRTMARGGLASELDPALLYAYFGGSLILYVAMLPIGRFVFGVSLAQQGLLAMATTFSNTVVLGIPLIFAVFGEAGAVPLLFIITFHSIVLMTLATLVVELGRGLGAGIASSLLATGRGLFTNPVVVALLLGLAYSASGLALPGPIDRFAELLGSAGGPCALFALGATLAAIPLRGNMPQSLALTGVKLFLHPLLVWLLASEVFLLPPLWVAVATITAALPAGVNVFILAQHYGIFVERAATTVILSTGVSVFTLAALIAYFAPS